jgi:drug/metabolite transporter (DMT)-like permease
MNQTPEPNRSSRALLIAAFAAVYVIWGSTYLAIRVAVETIPPFLMGAARFIFAGTSLMTLLYFRGTALPTKMQWRHALISGALLFVGGNGFVVWAEQTVTSSVTALIIATTPVWFALLDWLRPGGTRPQLQTVIGIAVGFFGVSLLINPHQTTAHSSGTISITGAIALVFATALWAAGSLYAKHNPKPESPGMTIAAQMISGGIGMLLISIVANEPARMSWSHVSTPSLWSFAYLVVFGSWIALSAYTWLLKNTTPAILSTYAYINPVIAVFLGWLLLKEPITQRTVFSAAIILLGVIIITLPKTLVQSVFTRGELKAVKDA